MAHRKLKKWIKNIKLELEKIRDATLELYGQFTQDKLHDDLVKWYYIELHFRPEAIENCFTDIIRNYNELLRHIENLEQELNKK